MTSPVRDENSRLLSPPRQSNGKERKDPSITPRKFKRFFTPRSRVPSQLSPARKALRDLTAPAVNQRYQTPAPSSPLKPLFEEDLDGEDLEFPSCRTSKRRKIRHTPESSPVQSPPLRTSHGLGFGLLSPTRSLFSSQEICESNDEYSDDDLSTPSHPPKRLLSLPSRGLAGQLAQRELGSLPRAGHAYMSYPAADWRIDTADFYSRPDDVHVCTSHERNNECIPFSAATCHRNGITAIGDQEGYIRLLDSSSDSSEPFSNIHLTLTTQANSIFDLDFSDDDYLLAAASADKTGQVIDMMTQSPIAHLNDHVQSLKQIRFQPGKSNGSVLATSARDGHVLIWDLRCSRPVQDFQPSENRTTNLSFRIPPPKHGYAVNYFLDAHVPQSQKKDGEKISGVSDVSVTALQFLSAGQEHLLLTACEADASIMLWDIRSIRSPRNGHLPLSATAVPESHGQWRPFGISSLALSTDASRLYAVCKDNTVYAYSTAHLILGHAPELSLRNGTPRRRFNPGTQQGLGPLYGFRHPSFRVSSFWIKSAIRPARNGRSELLAVGSHHGCAVLFPTQERYFQDELSGMMGNMSLDDSTISTTAGPLPPTSAKRSVDGVQRPPSHTTSSTNLSASSKDSIPIIRMGTPLVRGHELEVSSVSWTNEGKLITVSDDRSVRCWGEDRMKAADLRTGGESGGRRWCCGWAETGADWDISDDDDDEN
ncbi:WD40-repeat-containing domain protein [Xylaria cubensis]|nr:WD40-repeat-containing domain protein [Xylaria cubensis]